VIVGSQEWRELLFIHWKVPASTLRPLVHPRLSIDEREDSAWVSMTPFTLRNGRLRGLPPLPDFHELNFRTYVTGPGGPGIWFFSLEASSLLAVAAARLSARLPYFPARMERGDGWYRSDRSVMHGHFETKFSFEGAEHRAQPGSLEEFLCERYSLYSKAAGPVLWRGPVRHEPWPLVSAQVRELREDLSIAAGLPPLAEPHSAQYSPGVSVAFEHFRPC
jgi:uncharacterized protein YqjF (DUF2071 family)